jgi:chromosome segregation ATPase
MQTITPRASLAGLMIALCAGVAHGQTADGKVQSLGNASASASIMSREELRACLKDQASLKASADSMAGQRAALDAERKGLEVENDAIKAERDALAAKVEAAVQANNAKVAAQAASVNAFNTKMDELNVAIKRGDNVERRRQSLEREGKKLQADSDELNAANKVEQDAIAASDSAIKDKFAKLEARISEWNERNKQMNPVADAYDDKLQSWKLRCGTRNYRESDEKAIRAGK